MASPSTRRASRLVARMAVSAQAPVMRSTISAAASITCSQLSSSRRIRLVRSEARSVSTTASPSCSGTASASAMARATPSSSATGLRSAMNTPSGNSASSVRPSSMARRGLADATGTEEGDDAGAPEQPGDLGAVGRTADERCAGLGQVARQVPEGPQCGEGGSGTDLAHLVEAYRQPEVADLVQAQVDEGKAGRETAGAVGRQRRHARFAGRPPGRRGRCWPPVRPGARRRPRSPGPPAAPRRCGRPCAPSAWRPRARGGRPAPAARRRRRPTRRRRAGRRRRRRRPRCSPRCRGARSTPRGAGGCGPRGRRRRPRGRGRGPWWTPRCR